MVQEGRDCSEVLIQLAAVRAALNNTAADYPEGSCRSMTNSANCFGSKYSVARDGPASIPVARWDTSIRPVLKRDIDKAKAYLKAAGLRGDSDGRRICRVQGAEAFD
jgi:hypothetical protein